MALAQTDTTKLENEVVLALTSVAPDRVTVDPFPGEPQSYRLQQTAAMLVVYSPESYDAEQAEDGRLISLKREPTFDIVCVHRRRRTEERREGHGGVYDLVDIVVQDLAGEPAAGRVIVPEQTQPRGLNPRDKTWRYQVRCRLAALANTNRPSVGGISS